MVKVAMSSTKYVILGNFTIDGYIQKTDLIGAFFGQTEGLIGEELELSYLQKYGKIGRIDIHLSKKNGKTLGNFSIPTALNKTEVSLLAAAIESVKNIGHCFGQIYITKIRDERENKRGEIIKRAEELLEKLKEDLPETNEMGESIQNRIFSKKVKTYDNGNIFGGPNIVKDEKITLVEGRADVLNLVKNNYTNVVAFNGSNISPFIVNLCKNKEVTILLDDDRGARGELEELQDKIHISYFAFAENGKEVEELTLKEIRKLLKNKKEFSKEKLVNRKKESLKKTEKRNKSKKETVGKKEERIQKRKIKKVQTQEKQKKIEEEQKSIQNIIKPQIKEIIDSPKKDLVSFFHDKKNTLEETIIDHNRIRSEVVTSKKIYLRKNELNIIKDKIKQLQKNDKRDFIILDTTNKVIKKGLLSDFYSIERLNKARILIFDGVVESSILKKIEALKIQVVIAKKFFSKMEKCNFVIVKLFEDVLIKE